MIRSLCYKELGSTLRKAVPESPGVVEWKILIFVPVDDKYREIEVMGQPGGAHTIHSEFVKDVHT
jgi:hypothetical protein